MAYINFYVLRFSLEEDVLIKSKYGVHWAEM